LHEHAAGQIVERLEAHETRTYIVGTIELPGEVVLPGGEDDERTMLECPTGQRANARPRRAIEPLCVLDDEDNRLFVRHGIEEVDERDPDARAQLVHVGDVGPGSRLAGDEDGIERALGRLADGDRAAHRAHAPDDLDDTGERALDVVCLAFDPHDLDAVELGGARDFRRESRFADALFAADEAGLTVRSEQTVQDAFHVLHLLLAPDLRCTLLLGRGAIGFGDSSSEECGGHAYVARTWSELAQIGIEDLERANLAAMECGSFGEGECRFLVERIEQQTSCGQALDGCPIVSFALRGDGGDEHAPQSRRDDVAFTLEPFAERRREAWCVSWEKRALDELRDAIGVGAASRGDHFTEVGLR